VRKRVNRSATTYLLADRADELGLVLALQQVHDERVVSLLVHLPRLVSHHLINNDQQLSMIVNDQQPSMIDYQRSTIINDYQPTTVNNDQSQSQIYSP
jgi:hypothetical protein